MKVPDVRHITVSALITAIAAAGMAVTAILSEPGSVPSPPAAAGTPPVHGLGSVPASTMPVIAHRITPSPTVAASSPPVVEEAAVSSAPQPGPVPSPSPSSAPQAPTASGRRAAPAPEPSSATTGPAPAPSPATPAPSPGCVIQVNLLGIPVCVGTSR